MLKKLLLSVLVFMAFFATGQKVKIGYSVGVAFSFGTTINRLGIHTAAFVNYGIGQVNFSMNGYYNFRALGTQKKMWETQLGIGGQFGFGRKDSITNNFIGLTENNTFRDYSIGLTYLAYFDQQGTTQATGIINANILNFNVITENDLFGNLVHQKDRYRTGAFLIEYQYENTKVGINAFLWTYDYSNCRVIDNEATKEWSRFGYYQDNEVKSRANSVGVLSLKVSQWLPYRQQISVSAGINSEKWRNAFQNKFIHDQPFFSDKLVERKPAHIPMITIDNKQYLYEEGQVVKPAKLYFNFGLNNLPFY